MTSATKPEVNNMLHCRQRRTEPRPQLTRKVQTRVFEISLQTKWQTLKQEAMQTHSSLFMYFAVLHPSGTKWKQMATRWPF